MPILPMLIVMAGMIGVLALGYFSFAGPSPAKAQARRLESLKERHSKSGEVAAQAQLRRIMAGRETKMDGVASRFLPNPALLRKRLEQTGRSWGLGHYMLGSVGIGGIFALLLMVNGLPVILCAALGIFAGVAIPHMAVGHLIKRRVFQFTARFPDAIDLMVRGLRSGLPISETIGVVGQEIPGPIAVEFQSVSDKMKIGRTMEAALQETADRLGTPEFQFFVITLAIQRETGGNLAETLANLSDVLRKRAQMRLKIRAMSSESKASAYIVGALPFIVFGLIFMINPEYMGQFFTDQRLIVAGLGGMVWMSIGAFIMAKMINFEI
jgi:tight adherence protein B